MQGCFTLPRIEQAPQPSGKKTRAVSCSFQRPEFRLEPLYLLISCHDFGKVSETCIAGDGEGCVMSWKPRKVWPWDSLLGARISIPQCSHDRPCPRAASSPGINVCSVGSFRTEAPAVCSDFEGVACTDGQQTSCLATWLPLLPREQILGNVSRHSEQRCTSHARSAFPMLGLGLPSFVNVLLVFH